MTTVRFLHTSDWQLGMVTDFLPDDAAARLEQDRIDAVSRLFASAKAAGCEFAVVAGDLFDYNNVSARTLNRIEEVFRGAGMPIYILPGNHDYFDATHPYHDGCSVEGVRMITTCEPVTVADGVELVGAPLLARHNDTDQVAVMLAGLSPACGIRIAAGHGQFLSYGGTDAEDIIDLDNVKAAIDAHLIDYLAMGDTHSAMKVGGCDAVWYSGAPEVTRSTDPEHTRGEFNSGHGLIVTVTTDEDPGSVRTRPAKVDVEVVDCGRWQFLVLSDEVASVDDVERFLARLDELPDKAHTVITCELSGCVSMEGLSTLEKGLSRLESTFAGLIRHDVDGGVVLAPRAEEIDDLSLPAWARQGVEQLKDLAALHTDPAAQRTALDALALLFRLSGYGAEDK